jgi:low affinity Fe/Cu permease
MSKSKKPDIFTRFTTRTAQLLGRAGVFVAAVILIILWIISGPVFGFSDTWQLIINTSTTIITFLMVFIIQNSQNRDNIALNIKQDAMMKKLGITKEELIEAEEKSDQKLEKQKTRIQNNINGKSKKTKKQKKKKR